MMDWYQIKKHIYYTNDDYVRDIIAFHLKKGAMTAIYNYICKTPFLSMEESVKDFADCIEHGVHNQIITKVSHPLKHRLFSFTFACRPPYPLSFNTWLIEVMQCVHILHPIFPMLPPLQGF